MYKLEECTTVFNSRLAFRCHKEAVEANKHPGQTRDIGEKLVTEHEQQKPESRAMSRIILQNLHFLARQGFALRGHGDGNDSNLYSYCIYKHSTHLVY